MSRWLMPLPLRLAAALAMVLFLPSTGLAQRGSEEQGEWRYYASDLHATKVLAAEPDNEGQYPGSPRGMALAFS